MRIRNWITRDITGATEVSADIDDFRLWYRVPASIPVVRSGDPFLAAALLPAMAKGETLVVDPGLTVSPKLLENIALLQEIHHCWNPELKIVPISAETAPAKPLNEGAFSFFSGGVDSMYTFLKREAEISHAVFIHGFDFFADQGSFQRAVERNAGFVRGFGKTLIPVETNFYRFGYSHNLSRILTQGSTLGSVALLLGFSRAFIPSSADYGCIIPYGSHPLTDPLFSNEGVEVIHDGLEAQRIEKTLRIAASEPVLANLAVCVEDMNVNCGNCAKCLRTMTTLELSGKAPASFPWPLSFRAIRRVDWSHELNLLEQNIDFAARSGTGGRKLSRVLRARRRGYERFELLKEIDRVLLGGIVKKTLRKFAKGVPPARRIGVIPPKD